MPRTDFSSKEVAAVTGVPYQTLDFWIREGILTPDVPAEGIGSRRRFTRRDVVFVALARTLKDNAMPLSAIRTYVSLVGEEWRDDEPEHAGYLILKSWTGLVAGVYSQGWDRVKEMFDMARTMEMTPGDWNGLLWLVDVRYFARQTFERLAELRKPAGK